MLIQLNTDPNIQGTEALAQQVEAAIRGTAGAPQPAHHTGRSASLRREQ